MNSVTTKLNIKDSNVVKDIPIIVNSHILHLAANSNEQSKFDVIYKALKLMLNGHYEKYVFNEEKINQVMNSPLTETEFQKTLSGLNEKQSVRKANGVYYTPRDVIAFIVSNCFNNLINKDENLVSKNKNTFADDNAEVLSCIKTVFDPTCGSGEFLIYAFSEKIRFIIEKNSCPTDKKVLSVLQTVFGNDINIESIEITKIRLFFECIRHLKDINNFLKAAKIINANMYVKDFVDIERDKFKKYDVIIGNPPYVEDSKSISRPKNKYGNIYANVLQNSLDLLADDGAMGFIIPISYVSTPRMNKIRVYVEKNTSKQLILNYADRPDCLFASVHQKLSILIAVKGSHQHKAFTSSYKYWYKNERADLFNDSKLCENPYKKNLFYPKIGNKTELSIFKKIYTEDENNIIDTALSEKTNNVFLNMRACFWIKAFSFNPGSKEYKGFSFDEIKKDFMICLLNSSLYFLFWILTSDCWHITTKELKFFRVPNDKMDLNGFANLTNELENELEKTKKYIGSKQTDYEYKHKLCKYVIDKIDNRLADVYGLTKSEVSYIKAFASKYRESLGG